MATWKRLNPLKGSKTLVVNLENVAYMLTTKDKGTEIFFIGAENRKAQSIFVRETPDQVLENDPAH